MAAFGSTLKAGSSQEEKLLSLVEVISETPDQGQTIKSCACWGSVLCNVPLHWFKDATHGLPDCGRGGDRPLRLQNCPRCCRHSSSQRKWSHWFWRLLNFHPSPCPPQRNTGIRIRTNQHFELIPIVTDAARNFDSDHEEDEMMTSLTLSYPCRQPQCMALRCQSGLDQTKSDTK